MEREILGVIGPSGGGKTTLLRCLDMLETIDVEEMEYFGQFTISKEANGASVSIDRAAPKARADLTENTLNKLRKHIGFVFQGFNLWDERTVLENLTLAPRVVLGRPQKDLKKEALELCSQFGLEDKAYSRGWQLSGGEKQRVAIMRALMMKPRLMLLDEITSALDPVLTVEVMGAIRQLRERGLSMIIVTHHIEFASLLCDRIMFLSDGRAVQIETPERLRHCPANDEVKRFLDLLQTAR